MLYVVFSLLGRYMQMEVRTARGRIDMVMQTATDLYVMELKIDRPAREALEQIDQKGYLLYSPHRLFAKCPLLHIIDVEAGTSR